VSETDILFQISIGGQRLMFTLNLIGHLMLSIEGCGVRSSIELPYSDLYDLSDWIERYCDGGLDAVAVQP